MLSLQTRPFMNRGAASRCAARRQPDRHASARTGRPFARLCLPLLLVQVLSCWAAAPIAGARPPRSKPSLYLIDHDGLVAIDAAPQRWAEVELTPIVLLPRHSEGLYDPATTQDEVWTWCREIRERVAGPVYVAYWVCNTRDRRLLKDWDDDQGWTVFLERLGWLGAAARAYQITGVFPDLEQYYATRNLSGGPMQKGAWPDSPRIPERARAYVSALAGLKLGGYVWSHEVRRHPGLRRWLHETHTAAGGGVLLGEDYVGSGDRAAGSIVKARYVVGVMSLRAARRMNAPTWIYDPSRSVLAGP
jgi:hypothetical protein